MAKEHPWYYCLREGGTVTQGPGAGLVLDGDAQDILDPRQRQNLEAARALAAKHRALEPALRIEIWRKQFRTRPRRHMHYELVEVYP
jgi:hypothetical protein